MTKYNMRRVLITDLLFPSKYAKWRLNEIKEFIEHYDADIMVIKKIKKFNKICFDFDFDELIESHHLDEYDVLILNHKFNHLNKFNNNFDGTAFNTRGKGDYILRKKKFRNEVYNILNYDFIYHIFLMNYEYFKNIYKYPENKQFIHLYPGGGYLYNKNNFENVSKDVKLIPTQYFISEKIINNKFINVFGGPLISRDNRMQHKKFYNKDVNVCFTSMGADLEKGTHIYISIAKKYKTLYPKDTVTFYSIGNKPLHPSIKHIGLMSQKELDTFYYDNIDIIINLDTNREMNGFPLGVEALVQGVVLFTPDHNKSNKNNEFNYGEEMFINNNDVDYIIKNIHKLHDDRGLLKELSVKSQEKTFEIFGFENQTKKIFEFIDIEIK